MCHHVLLDNSSAYHVVRAVEALEADQAEDLPAYLKTQQHTQQVHSENMALIRQKTYQHIKECSSTYNRCTERTWHCQGNNMLQHSNNMASMKPPQPSQAMGQHLLSSRTEIT